MTIRPKKKSCKEKGEIEITDISKSVHAHLDQTPSSSWQPDVEPTSDKALLVHKRRHRSPVLTGRLVRGKHSAIRISNESTQNKKSKSVRSNIRRPIPPLHIQPDVECEDGNNSEDEYDNSIFDDEQVIFIN